MDRQSQVQQLDLYLAQHKGLLSNEEEQRYIDLIIEEGAKMPMPVEDGEEPQEEPISLELLKLNKKLQLLVYDSSPEINSFTIGGQSMWFGPALRANLKNAIDAMEAAQEETVSFKGIVLPIAQAKAALSAIELYAAKCSQVTEEHAAKIAAKKTAATIASYDFTTGYPEHPSF